MTDINRHRGLAIASLILGGISCFCCFGTGIGVIPAAIALVFSIIAVAKGGKNAKKLGIIGLILSAIGLVLNAVILAYGIWMIRWDHMTIENLSSIQNLNPANEKDIIEWLQQFIKVDISGMIKWGVRVIVSVIRQKSFVSRGSTFHFGPRRTEVPRTSCAAFAR